MENNNRINWLESKIAAEREAFDMTDDIADQHQHIDRAGAFAEVVEHEKAHPVTGLVIRCFMGGYYLCDGKPPEGCENDGELHVGNAVKWFETWDEANEMRSVINAAYGCSCNDWTQDEASA